MNAIMLIDAKNKSIATMNVTDDSDRYHGTIDLSDCPTSIRLVFSEYETIVNDQCFTVLDEIEDRVQKLNLKAQFEDGTVEGIRDLQVYPSLGDVSFKLASIPALTGS